MRRIQGVEVYFRRKKRKYTFITGIIKVILLLVIFYLIITHFFITSFEVESISMSPAFQKGDKVFSSPLLYGPPIPFMTERITGIQKPQRGDIVIITPPYYPRDNIFVRIFEPFLRFFSFQKASFINSPDGRRMSEYTVKRIIGIPGDVVMMKHFIAYIKRPGSSDFVKEDTFIKRNNTITVNQQYFIPGWDDRLPFSGNVDAVILDENQYFVLGDNRTSSNDSRSWGTLHFSRIAGKIILRYWPFNRFGPL
jgi:signal peptidase I